MYYAEEGADVYIEADSENVSHYISLGHMVFGSFINMIVFMATSSYPSFLRFLRSLHSK
jgi:hypothetical protein